MHHLMKIIFDFHNHIVAVVDERLSNSEFIFYCRMFLNLSTVNKAVYKSLKRTIVKTLLLICTTSHMTAQIPKGPGLNDSIPLDQEVKVGKLANGFTYYIRKNDTPAGKVVMYLTVKAG